MVVRAYLVRLAWIMAASLAFALVFNELTYRMQKDPADRGPRTIQLVIPAGTAVQVAAGQDAAQIPAEMIFVVGDVLEVVNQDTVVHQLGPVSVPPGTTGRLTMEQAQRMAADCSFTTQNYLGLDVRPATTLGTRIIALILTVPTLGVLVFLYSLALRPIRPRPNEAV